MVSYGSFIHLFLINVLLLSQVAFSQFTSVGQKLILDRHNEFRSQIAMGKYVTHGITKPTATNMMKIVWDENLQQAAQTFANTCPTGHSANRVNTGENLYWWTSPMTTTTPLQNLGNRSSNLWADEFQKFGWASNTLTMELFQTGIGHASQMAWAKTSKVGCGVMKFPTETVGTKYIVVCQYQPAGNYRGSDIYESGEMCSNCPSGTTCVATTGLCA